MDGATQPKILVFLHEMNLRNWPICSECTGSVFTKFSGLPISINFAIAEGTLLWHLLFLGRINVTATPHLRSSHWHSTTNWTITTLF